MAVSTSRRTVRLILTLSLLLCLLQISFEVQAFSSPPVETALNKRLKLTTSLLSKDMISRQSSLLPVLNMSMSTRTTKDGQVSVSKKNKIQLDIENDDSSRDSSRDASNSRSGLLQDPNNILQVANAQLGIGIENTEVHNRRLFFSSLLLSSSMALGGATIANPPPALAEEITWAASPVNKRSGISLFKAEETYNVRFITYLSRFLLSFDDECQKWWYQRAKDIPRTASADQVESKRLSQFGAFSASVEVGLQEYEGGAEGPKQLIKLLLDRYGGDLEEVKAAREAKGLAPLKPNEEEMEKREIKEAKRQIALLFSLLKTYQPVEEITALLAAIDNGMVKKVVIENPGGGYAPGYGEPVVTFPPPGGYVDGSKAATGRAVLQPSGKLLRIDISKRGFGYTKPPTVVISQPIAEDFGSPTAKAATAKASLFKDGVNKGRIERIQLTSPGNGYNLDEKIKITISPPELSKEDGGEIPLVKAILELEVGEITITNPGSGYAIEKPLEVKVEPPPLTARINLNDPMMAQIISPDKSISIADVMMSNSKESKAWKMANMKAGGGCIGRECYDQPVVAICDSPRPEYVFGHSSMWSPWNHD
jgi:hypothetical protein